MTGLAPSLLSLPKGLDVGRVDHHRQQQSHGIYDDMPLASGDFLACVIAPRPPFSVVFTLWLSMMAAPSASSGGSGIPAFGFPDHGPKRLVDPFPGLIRRPPAEVLVQCLPRRQIVGRHQLGATCPQHVQDAVNHLPQVHGLRPSSWFGWWKQRK